MRTTLLVLVIAVLIFGWTFVGLIALGYIQAVRKWLDEPGNHLRTGLWLGATALAMALWLVPDTWRISQLAPEITGLALAVIVIDELNRRRAALEYKRDILDQLGSTVHDAAIEAARIARKNEWTLDGSLENAILWEANLAGVGLWKANLARADLGEANLTGAYLAETKLMGADLGYADLTGAILQYANLKRALLVEANLEGADMSGANLTGAILSGANLKRAHLGQANLEGADMSGANLMDAILQGTNLKDALYTHDSIWPDDFDPRSAGALNWNEMTEQEQDGWEERWLGNLYWE